MNHSSKPSLNRRPIQAGSICYFASANSLRSPAKVLVLEWVPKGTASRRFLGTQAFSQRICSTFSLEPNVPFANSRMPRSWSPLEDVARRRARLRVDHHKSYLLTPGVILSTDTGIPSCRASVGFCTTRSVASRPPRISDFVPKPRPSLTGLIRILLDESTIRTRVPFESIRIELSGTRAGPGQKAPERSGHCRKRPKSPHRYSAQ
jgi:hypothetical protein